MRRCEWERERRDREGGREERGGKGRRRAGVWGVWGVPIRANRLLVLPAGGDLLRSYS